MTRRADDRRITARRLPAVLDAFTWGVGVAAGVAVGAYLTAVGGTGAPGTEGIELAETLTLPLIAGGVVFCLVLDFRAVAALIGRVTHPPRDDHRHGEHSQDHDVTRQVG